MNILDFLLDLARSINRNIVECKYAWRIRTLQESGGINRNIVECKYSNLTKFSRWQDSINRNIVECKFDKKLQELKARKGY